MNDRKVKEGIATHAKTGKIVRTGQYSDEAIDELIASGDGGIMPVIIIIALFAIMYWIF